MVKVRRVIKIGLALLTILAALCAIAAVVAVRSSRKTEHEAQMFLQEFVSLHLGQSTFEDARQVADRYGDRLWVGDAFYGHALRLPGAGGLPPGCSADHCDYLFEFQNTWLHRLHLARFTSFGAEIKIRNGLVVIRSIEFLVVRGQLIFFAAVVEDSTDKLRRPLPSRRLKAKTIIWLTAESTAAERQQSFAFNLECLSKIGGCKDSFELLPGPWPDDNAFMK